MRLELTAAGIPGGREDKEYGKAPKEKRDSLDILQKVALVESCRVDSNLKKEETYF